MALLSEKRDMQDALVNYLIGIGWETVALHNWRLWPVPQ